MSPHKDIKFPPLTPSQKQRLTYDHRLQNDTVQTSEESQGESAGVVSAQRAARNLCWTGSSYIYAGPGRKPELLMHLESYVNKELHTISSHEPNFQELKLQVYRDVFGLFIKEFRTYQPLLSAIKKEYENTLAYQQDQIRQLEPLRSHLRLVTEECDRKIQARWAEEQAEIEVDHLQSELSNQYLQYREERDARKLLIWQLNDLRRGSVKEEHPADGNTEEAKDPVELQLALRVCREDLTKAQEELNRMKADYWDVVPKRNWDTLEQTHKENLLQLKTLQGDFDQLKGEYDTLLKLHKKGSMQKETHDPSTVQMDESVSQGQSQIQPNHLKEPTNSDAPEISTLTVQEFRAALRTALPQKSDEEIDELVASAQSEPDSSNDTISSQRLHSLLAESTVTTLPPVPEESEENSASDHLPASD
ncbi:translin-associated factor X-interacting protein 1 isoform X4 [Epinephelus moara]|uniref:translin-associated factor X-interacting protein 1 isoform X4 n=1 Tax=Epinephelus moara TaxID=300413 RepID=UPI00214EC425|nr:translin-associated factor X-interacting protein 1 isoform X4 [Epinephelus moara]